MQDATFRLFSTIGIDVDQYDRDLKSAETSTRKTAQAMRSALSDIDVRFDVRSHRRQISQINKEARDLGISVRKYLALGFGEGASIEAQKASKAISGLVEAREKVLSKTGSSGFGSETLLRQLDQLRIGSEQLSRGSLGGLPNIIKGVAISANQASVEAGALSTRILAIGAATGLAAIAIVGGTIAFVGMANKAAEAANELEKLQDETGLSSERLQYLRASAALTNVEFTSITSAYKKYTEAAHDANSGNKELEAIFRILGQTTKNTNENSFEAFIKGLGQIKDESIKTEVAQKILGGSARDLERYFRELNTEGGRLKNILKESSQAMSSEAQAAAKAYGQEVERLKLESENLWNSVQGRGIPILTDLAGTLADLAIAARQFSFDNLSKGLNEYLDDALRAADRNKERLNGLPTGSIQSVPNKPTADDLLRNQDADRDVFPFGQPPVRQEAQKQKPTASVDRKLDRTLHRSSSRGSSAKKDVDDTAALNKALLALEKQRNEITTKLEQDRVKRQLEANEFVLQTTLRTTNDEIKILEKYYDERLKLQQDAIAQEIEENQRYYLQLQEEQDKAKKKSEKIRIQTEKERVGEKLRILNREFGTVEDKNEEERTKAIIEAKKKLNEENRKAVEAYKDLQSQLVELNGSEYDQFLERLQRTTKEFQHLAVTAGRLDLLPLLDQFNKVATERFKITNQNSILNSTLGLETKKVATQEDLGVITRGEANKKILEIERQIGAELVKNLELQIKIAETNGQQLEVLKLKSELEDAKLLGVDRERLRRLKEVRDSIANSIDETRDAIITGQVGIFDGLRQMAKNISTTFFRELEAQLIQRATGGKFSSVGEVIGASLGKIFDKIFGKVNPAKPTVNPVQGSVQQQTATISNIGQQQIRQGQQIIAELQEIANCSCQAALRPSIDSFGKSILKGAISGAISGLGGGLSGGFGGGSASDGEGQITAIFDEFGNRIPHRAAGGSVMGGRRYLVGERGPEIFTAQTNGSIIPNHELEGKEGSGLLTQLQQASLEQLTKIRDASEKSLNELMRGNELNFFLAEDEALPGGILGTLLGNALGAIGGGGPTNGAGGPLVLIQGIKKRSRIRKIKAMANGGTFSAFDEVIVGEEGPELVQFNNGGNVVPNNAIGGYTGSNITVIQHFNIRSDDGKFSRKSSQQLGMSAASGLQRAINKS